MTRLGDAFHALTLRAGVYLQCHMWLWWVLNLTWGLFNVVVGAIAFAILACTHHAKVRRYHTALYCTYGENWGGVSLGTCFAVAGGMGDAYTTHTMMHEYGHTFQSAIFGPFFYPLIGIPSFIRYLIHRHRLTKGLPCTEYDAIWFEGSATALGEIYEAQLD